MKRLVLVRHGQSAWNEQRRVQGHSGTGLTERGRAQAEQTARWVLATHPAATLVSSDLQRCVETTAVIAQALGVVPVLDADLRERSFGRWEGRTMAEIQALDPDLWTRWRSGTDVVREVGGESGEDLTDRVAPAFRRHVESLDDGQTVVVVTHGGPVWHGLHAMLDLPWGTLGGVGNASVTEVVLEPDRPPARRSAHVIPPGRDPQCRLGWLTPSDHGGYPGGRPACARRLPMCGSARKI